MCSFNGLLQSLRYVSIPHHYGTNSAHDFKLINGIVDNVDQQQYIISLSWWRQHGALRASRKRIVAAGPTYRHRVANGFNLI